jgi:hypothetical protein
MKKIMIFAVVAMIVALCAVSCSSEGTSKNSSESSTKTTALQKGVVFRTAVYGRIEAMTDVLLEDGTQFYAARPATCGDKVKFLAAGDTVFYYTEHEGYYGYVEEIHWK